MRSKNAFSNKTESGEVTEPIYVEKDHSDYNVIWGPGWKQGPVGCHLSETSRRDGGASNRVSTDSWCQLKLPDFLMHAAAWNSRTIKFTQFTFQFHIRSVTDPSESVLDEGSPDWSHMSLLNETNYRSEQKESCVFQWKNEGQARPLEYPFSLAGCGPGSFMEFKCWAGRRGGALTAPGQVCPRSVCTRLAAATAILNCSVERRASAHGPKLRSRHSSLALGTLVWSTWWEPSSRSILWSPETTGSTKEKK